jgi:DNA-binding ferritin-like protein
MPYTAKGKCVYKKDTGKKVGCTTGSVKKYLAALHANVDEGTGGSRIIEAIDILAEYIIAHGDEGVKTVERVLKNKVALLKNRNAVHEAIKSAVKEVLAELTAK